VEERVILELRSPPRPFEEERLSRRMLEKAVSVRNAGYEKEKQQN